MEVVLYTSSGQTSKGPIPVVVKSLSAVGTGYSNTPTVDKVLPAKEMYLRNTCIEQSSIEYVSLLTVVWLEMIPDWFEMIQ